MRKTYTFAGQPFQIAVRTYVHNGISLKYIADPAVISKIIMCRRHDRIMVDFARIITKAARRLETDKDIAVNYSRH